MGEAALRFTGSPLFLGSFPIMGRAVAGPSSMVTTWQPGTGHAAHIEIFKASSCTSLQSCKAEGPVPSHLSQAFSLPRGCSGASKPCWAKAPKGITSDAHEDTSDGSSLRPRPWSSTVPQQSPCSHAVPPAVREPPIATD